VTAARAAEKNRRNDEAFDHGFQGLARIRGDGMEVFYLTVALKAFSSGQNPCGFEGLDPCKSVPSVVDDLFFSLV
jgi:hypothetical protein